MNFHINYIQIFVNFIFYTFQINNRNMISINGRLAIQDIKRKLLILFYVYVGHSLFLYKIRLISMYFNEGPKRDFSTEVQFEEASGGHSITLRETLRMHTRTRRQDTLESALIYVHTNACLRAYMSEQGRSVLKWARGPPATRVGCIIISASLCCYAIRVR